MAWILKNTLAGGTSLFKLRLFGNINTKRIFKKRNNFNDRTMNDI